jgi:hypothetical protein
MLWQLAINLMSWLMSEAPGGSEMNQPLTPKGWPKTSG